MALEDRRARCSPAIGQLKGGLKGGPARASGLSVEERSEVARKATSAGSDLVVEYSSPLIRQR